METTNRLGKLREKMAKNNIDMFLIPTNDFHGSEYLNDYFKTREYISHFDGSAGTVLVLPDMAGLWTDGRYFLQAKEQLKGSSITLFCMGKEGVPEITSFILSHIPEGGVLGVDGRLVSTEWAKKMEKLLAGRGAKLDLSRDLVGEIWKDRPNLNHNRAFFLPEEVTGKSRAEKLCRLRKWMKKKEATVMLITALDQIAWLLNMRGSDILYNPVVLSYLLVRENECTLFVGENVFSTEDEQALFADGITLAPYEKIEQAVGHLSAKETVLVEKSIVNAALFSHIPSQVRVKNKTCPITAWKAVKNQTERLNMSEAHIRDGVALTRFLYWLKQNVSNLSVTEISAAEKLEEFRCQQEDYLGQSFEPIAAYASHGAIVHYAATEESNVKLLPENFLLLDTGGHYLQGTTDVTRTVLLGGQATEEQKKYYTAVLRGNLNLSAAKFKSGCTGITLDYAARKPLWDLGLDYEHGTGHGVGYLLNVHEGPNAIRYHVAKNFSQNAVLKPGMITSDEPGIYLENAYGIRLENLLLCEEREKNEFGQFLGFTTLTLVPFERDAIDPAQMSEGELEILNRYHRMVEQTIAPRLPKEERAWLKSVCAPITV